MTLTYSDPIDPQEGIYFNEEWQYDLFDQVIAQPHVGVFGQTGFGKTTTVAKLILAKIDSFDYCYANFHLLDGTCNHAGYHNANCYKHPHPKWRPISDFRILADIHNCLVAYDEIWKNADSRMSATQRNLFFDKLAADTRKQGNQLIFSVQDPVTVDKRVRYNLGYWLSPNISTNRVSVNFYQCEVDGIPGGIPVGAKSAQRMNAELQIINTIRQQQGWDPVYAVFDQAYYGEPVEYYYQAQDVFRYFDTSEIIDYFRFDMKHEYHWLTGIMEQNELKYETRQEAKEIILTLDQQYQRGWGLKEYQVLQAMLFNPKLAELKGKIRKPQR